MQNRQTVRAGKDPVAVEASAAWNEVRVLQGRPDGIYSTLILNPEEAIALATSLLVAAEGIVNARKEAK